MSKRLIEKSQTNGIHKQYLPKDGIIQRDFSETSQMFGTPTDSQIRTLGQKQRKSNMNSDVKQYNL